MTPRQIRRAAERKTRKQARKAANGSVFPPENAASPEIQEEPIEIPASPIHLAEQSNAPDPAPAPISASQLAAKKV
jgi:hypothetical protein